MKKTLSFVLALLILVTAFPFQSFASESDDLDREELIRHACEIFPEYADKILGYAVATHATQTSSEERSVVTSLTRDYSDNQTVAYTEYSDGVILLAEHEYNYTHDVTNLDKTTMSAAYTVNITATCVSSAGQECNGWFSLKGLKFTLISSSYDMITSTGTATFKGDCTAVNTTPFSPIMSETANGPAMLRYYLTFRFSVKDTDFLTSTLEVKVGGNSYKISHYAGRYSS